MTEEDEKPNLTYNVERTHALYKRHSGSNAESDEVITKKITVSIFGTSHDDEAGLEISASGYTEKHADEILRAFFRDFVETLDPKKIDTLDLSVGEHDL